MCARGVRLEQVRCSIGVEADYQRGDTKRSNSSTLCVFLQRSVRQDMKVMICEATHHICNILQIVVFIVLYFVKWRIERYLLYAGDVSCDVFYRHWVLQRQLVALALHAGLIDKNTCV